LWTPIEGGALLRHTLYLKFAVVMVVLTALALMLGTEPWGPY
jgi:hypothetical protein